MLHHSMLITHLQTRVSQPGLAQLTDPHRSTHRDARGCPHYQRAVDQLTRPDLPHEPEVDSVTPTSSAQVFQKRTALAVRRHAA